MKIIFKFAPLLLLLLFCQCSEKEPYIKPIPGIVKFNLDNETHYFTHIGISNLDKNGFVLHSDTLPTTSKSFSISIAHYTPLDSIKVGHKYPLTYLTRFVSGALLHYKDYHWKSANDYLTNEQSGNIEVLAWDGKTMEAKIDFWAVNISTLEKPEIANYREKHITGYFKIRVR
jgi:hypothetical protein